MSVEIHPPTWWLNQLLTGAIDMHDAPVSVQSWARLPIYEGAREIIMLDTREERARELARVPERIRPYVAEEVKRLWPRRAEVVGDR